MRIHADVGKCQGYGNCVAVDQQHFDLDDDGLVVIRRDEVAADERDSVEDAVRSCPAVAIWLTDDGA